MDRELEQHRLDLHAWSTLSAARSWMLLCGGGLALVSLGLAAVGAVGLQRSLQSVGTAEAAGFMVSGLVAAIAAGGLLASVWAARHSLRRTLELHGWAWWSLAVALVAWLLVGVLPIVLRLVGAT